MRAGPKSSTTPRPILSDVRQRTGLDCRTADLGFDHTRLTYRFQGRDFRLTDVQGEIVRPLLA